MILEIGIWHRLKRSKLALTGAIIILLLIVIAVFAPLLAPYDPIRINLAERLQGPNIRHLFGTDNVGRDILSRTLYGTRISLAVGFAATFFSMSIGLVFGTLAGFFGGKIDAVIMRFVDLMLSFPGLLLAIGIAVSLGPGLFTLFIALGCVGWAGFARLVRGIVLSIMQEPYIEAARAIGCGRLRIIIKHLLPNCLPLVIVTASLKIATFVLSEAGLSFLGLGAQPPTPSWGSMVSLGRDFIRTAPYMSVFPGLAIAITVIGFNLLGDGLRDLLDPKLNYF
ncbi:ABC transporter permease [bacterium]|nr:ABC transporter permease [bacterium]